MIHEPLIFILPPHTLQFSGIRKGNNMYFTRWPPCPYPMPLIYNTALLFLPPRLYTINHLYWIRLSNIFYITYTGLGFSSPIRYCQKTSMQFE